MDTPGLASFGINEIPSSFLFNLDYHFIFGALDIQIKLLLLIFPNHNDPHILWNKNGNIRFLIPCITENLLCTTKG